MQFTREQREELKGRIEPLRQQVEEWGKYKGSNEKMSEPLWEEAFESAKVYGDQFAAVHDSQTTTGLAHLILEMQRAKQMELTRTRLSNTAGGHINASLLNQP